MKKILVLLAFCALAFACGKENADKKFVIKEFAQASASSKKKAQLAAAEKAWRIIQNDDSTDSVAAPNGANSPSASGEANADHAA